MSRLNVIGLLAVFVTLCGIGAVALAQPQPARPLRTIASSGSIPFSTNWCRPTSKWNASSAAANGSKVRYEIANAATCSFPTLTTIP